GKLLVRLDPDLDWFEMLERSGRVPLPPYIRDGQMTEIDRQRYQTVYARHPGSVAAPTAGLHLTEDLLQKIRSVGVALVSVTLHVGLGTFRPVQVSSLDEHTMHTEWAQIQGNVVRRLLSARAEGGRILAVGTTTVRTLETAALKGNGKLCEWTGETDLFIRPGHRFAAVDRMLTNFHLPRSTLLVLVSTFATRELMLEAYRKAVEEKYRFFSYGDCMLILLRKVRHDEFDWFKPQAERWNEPFSMAGFGHRRCELEGGAHPRLDALGALPDVARGQSTRPAFGETPR
ncbi:MAG: tRNA preQ1(34) S-adenosylmethionine ribosyltransferase-isomerase QueA, partial [Planctomycetota bacterium]